MRVSALQFCPAFLDPRHNLDFIASKCMEVDTDLAVIPELATTGYFFADAAQLREYAEPVDGPTGALAVKLAREKSMAICCGFAEQAGADIFNSAILALPDGRVSVYRKTHLFGAEKTMFTPGDSGFTVVEWRGARIGTMICYDWRFPEAARTLALRGAQIICHPSDLVAQPRLWQPVMRARAVENKVCIITADRTGTETQGSNSLTFHGCSQIAAVNGTALAEADETFEGWIHAEINPADADDKSFSAWNDIFSDRRPDMYEH